LRGKGGGDGGGGVKEKRGEGFRESVYFKQVRRIGGKLENVKIT